jgi:aerobic carbon-monoxide dehydrogenase medium subunit
VRSADGERTVVAADFFRGFLETALRPGEMLVGVRIPVPAAGHGWSYRKFTRRALDWAIVGVAAVVEPCAQGIERAAVALVNMGPTPLRAAAVEAALRGAPPDAVAEASSRAAEGTEPAGDIHAAPEFRRHLARVLTRRALEEALGRC